MVVKTSLFNQAISLIYLSLVAQQNLSCSWWMLHTLWRTDEFKIQNDEYIINMKIYVKGYLSNKTSFYNNNN